MRNYQPKAILAILCTIIFASCSPSLDGKYIKTKNNGRAEGITGIFNGLVKELEFSNDRCRISYFGMKLSGKYTIDGKYVFVDIGGEMGTLQFEIVNKNTLEGEGWAAGTFSKMVVK